MKDLLTSDIKAVIFDFDDTLVGTHIAIWNMHRHIAKKHYGIELDDETLSKHWGQPIHVLAGHYYQTDDKEQGVKHILEENANFPKTKFDYTLPVLKKLRQAGKKIGIVTASHLELLEKDLITGDLTRKDFDYIQTADDTDKYKPNPQVFDPLLSWSKLHGIAPSEILYVGDGLHDMEAAVGAGLNFIGVTTGLITAEEFSKQGAKSIADLSALIENF